MDKVRVINRWIIGLIFLSSAGLLFGCGVIERGSGDLVTERYDLEGFTEIDASGSWNIQITEGKYGVEVEVDDNILEYVQVRKRGDSLVINTKGGRFTNATFNASISLPNLESIDTSGSSTVRFSGFSTKRLVINSSGSSDITGWSCRIARLKIDSSGSSDIDLKECEITDAEIDLSGSSEVILTMAGGDLTGDSSGSGSITYYGEVDRLNVQTSGSSRIIKE